MLISRSEQPVIVADRPWEANGAVAAAAAFVEGDATAIRVYYRVHLRNSPQRDMLCMARSRDLVHWEKPDLGDGTNVVMRGTGLDTDWGTFCPYTILHNPSSAHPDAAWSMLYWDRPAADTPPGFCIATSSDGLRWQPRAGSPIITNMNDAGSMIDAIPAPGLPLGQAAFYIYQQTWKHNAALPTERDNLKGLHRRISIWRAGSLAGRWVGPITILEPDDNDPADVQFYWLTPFHRDRGYGGLLLCHHTTDQTMDVQLVTSTDGWTWRRALDRHPLLGLGERGRFDCGIVTITSAPLVWQGRVIAFYSGRPTVHDGRQRYADDAPTEAGIGIAQFTHELLGAPDPDA